MFSDHLIRTWSIGLNLRLPFSGSELPLKGLNFYGYKGKQVRDNIHASDFVNMFLEYFNNPRPGEVYNVGGGRDSNCSMLEAIALCEELSGKTLDWRYSETNRIGDHIRWVSDLSKFQGHYPNWSLTYGIKDILREIYDMHVRVSIS